MATNNVFNEIYNSNVAQTVEFQDSWNNGTGYMDGAVKAPLKPGVYKAHTGQVNDRRLVIIRTRKNTVVMFDRYTAAEDNRVVCNHDLTRKDGAIYSTLEGVLTEEAQLAALMLALP
jgi:hypothetical protein